MKRKHLAVAGLLLLIIAVFLIGPDSPVMGIALLTGIILLFIGSFPWARTLHWYVALAIGGMMLAAARFAIIYIHLIIQDQFVGDERNEFLSALLSIPLGVIGIVFISAGVVGLYRWLQSSLEKQMIKKRSRVRLRF